MGEVVVVGVLRMPAGRMWLETALILWAGLSTLVLEVREAGEQLMLADRPTSSILAEAAICTNVY